MPATIVHRSASAPYRLTTSSGSMPLPSDLDILRCCVSRTMPCRNTVWNGVPAVEEVARHDHARDPEEQDVRAGDEHVGRVERAEILVRSCRASRAWRAARATTRTTCRARPRPVAPARRTWGSAPRRCGSRPVLRTRRSTTRECGGPTRAAARCSSRECSPASGRTRLPTARERCGWCRRAPPGARARPAASSARTTDR